MDTPKLDALDKSRTPNSSIKQSIKNSADRVSSEPGIKQPVGEAFSHNFKLESGEIRKFTVTHEQLNDIARMERAAYMASTANTEGKPPTEGKLNEGILSFVEKVEAKGGNLNVNLAKDFNKLADTYTTKNIKQLPGSEKVAITHVVLNGETAVDLALSMAPAGTTIDDETRKALESAYTKLPADKKLTLSDALLKVSDLPAEKRVAAMAEALKPMIDALPDAAQKESLRKGLGVDALDAMDKAISKLPADKQAALSTHKADLVNALAGAANAGRITTLNNALDAATTPQGVIDALKANVPADKQTEGFKKSIRDAGFTISAANKAMEDALARYMDPKAVPVAVKLEVPKDGNLAKPEVGMSLANKF